MWISQGTSEPAFYCTERALIKVFWSLAKSLFYLPLLAVRICNDSASLASYPLGNTMLVRELNRCGPPKPKGVRAHWLADSKRDSFRSCYYMDQS